MTSKQSTRRAASFAFAQPRLNSRSTLLETHAKPRQFVRDRRAFVEPQPAAHALRFAGSAIRKFGIGMQAGHRRICPGAVKWFPRGNDPARAFRRTDRDVGRLKNLVRVRLLVKAR